MLDEKRVIKKLQNRIDAFLKNHPEQKGCKEVQTIKEIIQMLEQEAAEYKNGWIPCSEKYPDNEEYILLSFENFPIPAIGRYEIDKEGGAFFLGDEEKSLASIGVFVNAWLPLPKRYEESEE